MKLAGVRAIGQGLTGVLGLLLVVPDKLLYYVIGNLIAFVLPIVFILVYDKTKGVPKEEEEEVASVDEDVKIPVKAVVDGTVIPVADIKDGVFSEKVLGDGIGILPESETIVAPADGEICTVMEGSNHAVGIRVKNNMTYLIHVGIDTINMNGDGFQCFVKVGDQVKAGEKLLTFNKKKIEENGLNPVVVFVKTEEGNQSPVTFHTGMKVSAGKDIVGE